MGEIKRKNRMRALFFFLILVFLIAAIRLSGLHTYLDQERLRQWIDGFGTAGPIIYILIFSIAPSLFLPGLPITVAGGLVFGPLWGTVYASIGSTLGAGIAFLVARYFARNAISEMLGERWKKIDEGVTQKGWIYVAITRLIPVFPFNLLNYAFGLTKIPFITYLLTSWVFMLPGTMAYVVFSSSILDLLKGKVSVTFVAGFILLLLVSAAPLIYRRWKGSKGVLLIATIAMGAAISIIYTLSLADTPMQKTGGETLLLLTGQQGEDSLPKDWKP
ncbi:MAG: TVP38/TMEM64 family protein, partial [Nitrospirota bacterium]